MSRERIARMCVRTVEGIRQEFELVDRLRTALSNVDASELVPVQAMLLMLPTSDRFAEAVADAGLLPRQPRADGHDLASPSDRAVHKLNGAWLARQRKVSTLLEMFRPHNADTPNRRAYTTVPTARQLRHELTELAGENPPLTDSLHTELDQLCDAAATAFGALDELQTHLERTDRETFGDSTTDAGAADKQAALVHRAVLAAFDRGVLGFVASALGRADQQIARLAAELGGVDLPADFGQSVVEHPEVSGDWSFAPRAAQLADIVNVATGGMPPLPRISATHEATDVPTFGPATRSTFVDVNLT